MTLGKSLYLSGPRFLQLGLCGEVGWGILFGDCQGHQASLTLIPPCKGGVTILPMSTFSDMPTDLGWEFFACPSLAATRKFSSYSKSKSKNPHEGQIILVHCYIPSTENGSRHRGDQSTVGCLNWPLAPGFL